jgi:hypothetical protein
LSATESQAAALRRQYAADHREPEWKRETSTATERQAAALLAPPADERDGEGTDEHDAMTHPDTHPDRRHTRRPETATERQAAALRD